MIDVSVKFALVAAVGWLLTRGVTPRHAPGAHRLWLAVMLSPALLLLGGAAFRPVAYLRPDSEVWPATIASPPPALLTIALALYSLVAIALLLRTLAGIVAVRQLIGRSIALNEGELRRLRGLARQPTIDIRESDLMVPVTAGFVQSIIILPGGWRGMTPAALSAILLHESTHVRRRDCTVALLCAMVEAAFWFHPAAWLAGSRVRWFAEMACDAEAAHVMNGEDYASALLELAAGWNDCRRPLYTITAGAETGVARRIRLLLDEIDGRSRRRLFLTIAAIALLIGLPLSAAIRIDGTAAGSPTSDHHPAHDVLHQMRHRH